MGKFISEYLDKYEIALNRATLTGPKASHAPFSPLVAPWRHLVYNYSVCKNSGRSRISVYSFTGLEITQQAPWWLYLILIEP